MPHPVALITGAAHRLGAHTAETLHARGWNVVIHYRGRQQQARALADKLNQRLGAVDFTQFGTIGITERVMAVPFLQELLSAKVDAVLPLASADAGRNFSQLGEGLSTDRVRRLIAGSSSVTNNVPANTKQPDAEQHTATHLLRDHVAFAFDHPAVKDYIDAPLKPGDTVAVGDQTYTAIRLE